MKKHLFLLPFLLLASCNQGPQYNYCFVETVNTQKNYHIKAYKVTDYSSEFVRLDLTLYKGNHISFCEENLRFILMENYDANYGLSCEE